MRKIAYSTWFGLAISCLMCGIAAGQTSSQSTEKVPTEDSAIWRFQRLLVPADHPEDWPHDASQHYLPMSADEFEQRIAQLRPGVAIPAPPTETQLIRAIYTAELADDKMLVGKLEWTFEHRGSAPDTLALGDCQISLTDLSWFNGASSSGENRGRVGTNTERALVGNDQNGRLAAVVDRAGTMHGRWSLPGQRDAGEALSFDLQLPVSGLNQLQLTLPTDLKPSIDGAIVSTTGSLKENQRTWQIELGGKSRATLRIVKQSAQLETTEKTFVRESFRYECSPHGLELTAEFRLDVPSKPLRQIKLQVDRPLSVVKAHIGEIDVPITVVDSGDKDRGDVQNLELELPGPIQASSVVLQLTAIAPITFGTSCRLPLVKVKNSDWQTGEAQLIVPSSLVLDDLVAENSRQTGAESLSEPISGEAIRLAFFRAHPGIEITLSRRPEQLRVRQGSSIFLRANEGSGRYVGEFEVDNGELFALEAEIAPQWIIEEVESTPPGMVADWSQHLVRGAAGKLSVQLASPLTTQHKIRLSITGRRRTAPWGETMHVDDLAMLKFAGAAVTRRLIEAQTTETYQLQLRGAEQLTRLDSAHLSTADAELLDEKSSGLVFADDEHAQNLAVSITGKAPQYDADIQSEALVENDRLTESYRFSIKPQGREVARFNVRFSQLRNTPITWSIEGEPGATVTARRLTESEGSVVTWPGDVWEIVLPSPCATSFVLLASRSTILSDDMPLALASLLEAETQQGMIEITSVADRLPEIRSRRLKAIPIDPSASDQYATAVAAFRYDPDEDTLLTAEPPLVLSPHGSDVALGRAWIWQAQLESHYSRSGVENMLTCRVENSGQEQLQFQVPTGAELQSALIDGQRTTDVGAGNGSWKINLPEGERFCTVALYWNNQPHPVQGIVASCVAPWPVTDVPILSRQWMVWIPPNAAIADVQIGNSHMLDVSCGARLFGLLAPGPNNSVEKFQVVHKSSQAQGESDEGSADSGKSPVKTDTDDKRTMASAAGLQSPWKSVPEDQWSDNGNWRCYRFDGSGAADRLWIADKHLFWSWTWSLFVVAVALRWRVGNGRLLLDIGLLGIATVVALVIPAPWAPLSAAVWLGIVGGQLMAWISLRTRIRNSVATSADDSATTVAGMATALSLVVVAAILAGHGFAKADEAESSLLHTVGPQSGSRVLVPIDHDGQPTGGFYYVPEAFRDELLRATVGESSPPQYLVIRASYRPHTGQASWTGEPNSGDWEAEYTIESLMDHAELKLPLGFDGAALVPNGVTVDGQPAAFGSDDRNQNLLVALNSRGAHRLVVLLHPAANSDGISFAIPRVADSQLDLRGIDTSKYKAQIHSTNAVTDSRRSKRENQVVGSNPLERIEIRSSELAVPIETSPVFDIEELYWLRIRPNSIVVDARFHLNVHAGSVRQLYLHADHRWRPVSPQENGSTSDTIAVSQTRPLPGDSSVWVIELAQPATGRATVDLAFKLDTESGIGRWQPLRWEIVGARTAQRWWAATVDRGLQFALSPSDNDPDILPEKFTSMWPSRSELPQVAWQSKPDESSRSITTWPRESKLAVQYQLATIAGRKELDLRLGAHVKVVDGPVFQYRLRIPPEMEIDTVSLREQGVVRPIHWSRSRSDLATVFLDSPVSKESDLLVVGRVPLSSEAKFILPQMNIEESVAQGFRALIFRRAEVLLQVSDPAGLQPLPESDFAAATTDAQHEGLLEPIAENADSGRHPEQQMVSVLTGHDFQPATLHIEPNQPQMRALQVATLSRSADAWLATLNLDLQINSGVVDALRFDLPANWIGPFEISPAMPYSVEEITGENRRQLVVRPESTSKDSLQLKISGPLTIASGQRASAPDVRLVGGMRQTRFFLLPRRLENQQLSWETRGLVPRPLPEVIASVVPEPSSYRPYQLVGDHCRAELRSIERGTENAQVRLLDVDWSWDASGKNWGVAAFDLDPAGVTSCELQLPATEFLVQAELDSAPAQLSPRGENRWTVWLGDNKLPRHLEVIFAGDHPDISGNSLTLTAPTLVDLPVERTLWNVRSPNEAGASTPPMGTSISPLRHQQLRLECAAASIDSANSLLLDESTSDLARWYTLWLRRFAACRADLIMAKSAEPADELSQGADAQLKAIDQDQAKLAHKLTGAKESEALLNKPLIVSDWLHLAAFVESPPYRTTQAVLPGDGSPLVVEYARQSVASQQWRYIMATAVGLLTVGLLLALRFTKPAQTKFIYNSQY